jgi:hypothetical protein
LCRPLSECFTYCHFLSSNIHEPFQNLDQYLGVRRVNIAIVRCREYASRIILILISVSSTCQTVSFCPGRSRTLLERASQRGSGIRWTLTYPMRRSTTRSCGKLKVLFPVRLYMFELCRPSAHMNGTDHVGLVNDYFSYLKEKLSNSDDTNIIRMLMDHEGLDYNEALKVVINKIRQKEQDFIPAGLAVINHPKLGQNSEVHRWIASLPYVMGGNKAWSQEVGTFASFSRISP